MRRLWFALRHPEKWIDEIGYGDMRQLARIVFVVISYGTLGTGGGVGVVALVTALPVVLLVLPLAALATSVPFFRWLFDIKKEKPVGSDRRTEEDSQDSDTNYVTFQVALNKAIASTFNTGASTGVATTAAPAEKLEEVESDVPILAHRSAFLRFNGTDKPFGPVNVGLGSFGVDADAICADLTGYVSLMHFGGGVRKSHTAPDIGCSCGFYALPPDMDSTYEGNQYVTLLVELSGRVIEHEQGYRAQHQRVVECQLPACPYCGSRADVVLVADHAMQEACCVGHTPKLSEGQVVLDIAAVTRLLPVPVTRLGTALADA